jgi:hypothetical protein
MGDVVAAYVGKRFPVSVVALKPSGRPERVL